MQFIAKHARNYLNRTFERYQ